MASLSDHQSIVRPESSLGPLGSVSPMAYYNDRAGDRGIAPLSDEQSIARPESSFGPLRSVPPMEYL